MHFTQIPVHCTQNIFAYFLQNFEFLFEHFNQKGHKVSDMSVSVLEKIFSADPAVLKEREKYFIAKMNTRYKGLNKITCLTSL